MSKNEPRVLIKLFIQKWASCSYKIVHTKRKKCIYWWRETNVF